jgi:hypothetical protein
MALLLLKERKNKFDDVAAAAMLRVLRLLSKLWLL